MEHQAKSAAEQAPSRIEAERISEPAQGRAGKQRHSGTKRNRARAMDSNPRIVAQRQLAEAMDNSPRVTALRELSQAMNDPRRAAAQRKPTREGQHGESTNQSPARANDTGLPDQLKSGIESLSGISLDNVRVHLNSSQPARLNALAYAQGTDIHVAPGQERHLPHEAWHVVQQAQGRVKPTLQMKGVAINDDARMEHEAHVMGERAAAGMPQLMRDGNKQDLTPHLLQDGAGGADRKDPLQFSDASKTSQAKRPNGNDHKKPATNNSKAIQLMLEFEAGANYLDPATLDRSVAPEMYFAMCDRIQNLPTTVRITSEEPESGSASYNYSKEHNIGII